MKKEDPHARLKELYLPTTKDFVFVDVPEMQFVMVDGEGGPDDDQFKHAVRWLFSAIYPIKRIAKERMGKDFVEPPLEGLWWAGDMDDFMSVQIMHIGDYRREAATLAKRLHNESLPQHNLVPNGHHHEIYLSDPNRVAPEKMRTVMRQPVRPTEGEE